MSNKYSIMTFNTRYNTKEDGPYRLKYRFEYIAEYLSGDVADVIGFQEVEEGTQKKLREVLADKYLVLGCGRLKNFSDESSCIAFRRDKFELLSYETFWLSPTPGLGNSTPADVFPGRVCTSVCLIPTDREKGADATPFRVYNTHLFHTPDERLRTYGIYVILERMRRDSMDAKYPIVFMGDLNSTPDSVPVQAIAEYAPIKLTDATADVGYTYHEYENENLEKTKIDYIFTDAKVVEGSVEKITCRRESDGMFLSDHYPIRLQIEL